jgi:hypothetical protein
MRLDLLERLEFLADELAREEALVLVPVSAQLVMEVEDWSVPVQMRFVERDEPGLFDLEVREVGEGAPFLPDPVAPL